jgi:hypothetical protein
MRVRKDALTLRWVVATVLIGVYAGVLASLTESVLQPARPVVLVVLGVLAALLTAGSIVVPRTLLADESLTEPSRMPIDAHRWARRMRLKGAHIDAFVALPARAQRIVGLTILFERPYMLGLLFAGGVGVLGLAYGMLTQSLIDAAPFLLVAVALNCWHYPRLSALIERGSKLHQADKAGQSVARKPTGPRLKRKSRPHGPVKS